MNPNMINDDDSAPEDVSFSKSKQEIKENVIKVKRQLKTMRDVERNKRKERQEKNIEQKKEKNKILSNALVVPEEILNEIGLIAKTEKKSSNSANQKEPIVQSVQKTNRLIKIDDNERAISDFVPLRSYKKLNISVADLSTTDRNVLIASEAVKNFKQIMLNRRGINRQTSQERLSMLSKRRIRFAK